MPDSWFSEEKMHKNFIRDVYAMYLYLFGNRRRIKLLYCINQFAYLGFVSSAGEFKT